MIEVVFVCSEEPKESETMCCNPYPVQERVPTYDDLKSENKELQQQVQDMHRRSQNNASVYMRELMQLSNRLLDTCRYVKDLEDINRELRECIQDLESEVEDLEGDCVDARMEQKEAENQCERCPLRTLFSIVPMVSVFDCA